MVRQEDSKEFCERLNLEEVQVSSKTGDGVNLLFTRLAQAILKFEDY